MIQFFNPEVSDKPITKVNDIIKYLLSSQTAGFSCDTQSEAEILNYIIQRETYGEVYKPGKYWWVERDGYIFEDDIDS